MISIVLLTYAPSVNHPRHGYAERTLKAALAKLITREQLSLHIAHDGSGQDSIDALVRIAKFSGYDPTITNSGRYGYGLNYNLACQVVHSISEFVLPLEDDWELQKPLYLDPLVAALRESSYGCIRLGYLGWYSNLVAKLERYADQNFLYFLEAHSNDPHIWTGHPRLETVRWQQSVGEWPVGFEPGTTEMMVSSRPAARSGVLWPLDLIQTSGDLFVHIGTERAR